MNDVYRYNWATGEWELTGRVMTIRGIDPGSLFSGEQLREMVESTETFKAARQVQPKMHVPHIPWALIAAYGLACVIFLTAVWAA